MNRTPGLGFFLFVLLNAVLFIRPVELMPWLGELPIYNAILVCCLAVSSGPVIRQLASSLGQNPINTCVLGMIAAVSLSHLNHFRIPEAIGLGIEMGKVVIYYFLMVGVLDSFVRLRRFLLWLCVFVVILVSLAMLHYYHFINIPSLEAYHERQWELEGDEESDGPIVLARLQSVGIYGNPNDLSRILVVGILLCLYFLGDPSQPILRVIWLFPMALFAHGLQLTQSRGGLLALLGGLFGLFVNRLGPKKALAVTAAVPAPPARPIRRQADQDVGQRRDGPGADQDLGRGLRSRARGPDLRDRDARVCRGRSHRSP